MLINNKYLNVIEIIKIEKLDSTQSKNVKAVVDNKDAASIYQSWHLGGIGVGSNLIVCYYNLYFCISRIITLPI